MTGYFEYAFVPGITPEEWEDRSVFLNAHYDADVSPPDWNCVGTFGPFEGGPSTEGDDPKTTRETGSAG